LRGVLDEVPFWRPRWQCESMLSLDPGLLPCIEGKLGCFRGVLGVFERCSGGGPLGDPEMTM
jgi:hypothetical protein